MLDSPIADMDAGTAARRNHLMVAGTGRAGTTFLVRYLTELGLTTHLSRNADAVVDARANAGLEDLPVTGDPAELPYVIKSPWLHEYVEELLQTVQLDAVIVPVRDLNEAASSRILVEMDTMHGAAPWLARHAAPWDSWGWSPGGAVFSLDAVDQARLLAVGFHNLIERLVRADVPIVFLSFPRMVLDAKYVHHRLSPVLPHKVSEQAALAAHARSADATGLRVGAELAAPVPERPDLRDLDMIAVRRQMLRLRADLAQIRASRSWRLMAPLRGLSALARRLRR
jgi:hypothetical protein